MKSIEVWECLNREFHVVDSSLLIEGDEGSKVDEVDEVDESEKSVFFFMLGWFY